MIKNIQVNKSNIFFKNLNNASQIGMNNEYDNNLGLNKLYENDEGRRNKQKKIIK